MAIALAAIPKEAKVVPRILDFGARLNPPLGGASQYIARIGDRCAVDVELPVLDDAPARALIGARARAKAEGQTLTLAWPCVAQATIGAPLANGAAQTGTSLIVDGITPGKVILPETWFSYPANGRHYLHMVTTQVAADGLGAATLNVAPMLRFSPADNAALEFVAPVLEGFIDGDVEWTLTRLTFRQTSFTLQEDQ